MTFIEKIVTFSMLTHRNVLGMLCGSAFSTAPLNKDDVHLSYLPLAHVMERALYIIVSMEGGKIGIACGDITKL